MDAAMRNLIELSVDKAFDEVTIQLQATVNRSNRSRSPGEMFAKLR